MDIYMNIINTYAQFFNIWVFIAIAIIVILKSSIKSIPQNTAVIVERFGKYNKTMVGGLNFIIPFIDKVAYRQNLKEQAFDVPSQSTITQDNISLIVDGILYLKVIDPYKASYGIDNYIFSVTQLAQTTMRSEIGKLTLDKTFEERATLNVAIVNAINEASSPWGVQVFRYEIKDIEPPRSVLDAMERQMKAEREKRAVILESEGNRQSEINIAEGRKAARVLAAEAERQEQILKAEGEAQALIAISTAQANALSIVGKVASTNDGQNAIQLDLAVKAIAAKQAIAKESSIILLPENSTTPTAIIAEAMSIISQLNKKH
ncbi:paraslipin [Photobacterium carnosum]|nr:paraslipin [Photobacterium carnosum]